MSHRTGSKLVELYLRKNAISDLSEVLVRCHMSVTVSDKIFEQPKEFARFMVVR